MPKFVVAGHTSFCNRGNEALVRSTISLLESRLPGSEFCAFSLTPRRDDASYHLTTPTIAPHLSNALQEASLQPDGAFPKVRFLPLLYNPALFYRRGRLWLALNKKFGLNLRQLLRMDEDTYEAIRACDMLVLSGGDLLAGYGLNSLQRHTFLARTAIGLGKPVIVFAHSFNPYESTQERDYARQFLNTVSQVTVREAISQNYLKEVGIITPVHRSADPAFWLAVAAPDRVDDILVKESIPLAQEMVGISASTGLAWYLEGAYEKYINILAGLADHIIDTFRLPVVLIPHVIGPKQLGGDDRFACQDVQRAMRNTEGVFSIAGEYNALELKGLIGRCKLLVGTRMHATIAALSQRIPTIGLAYSVKAHGVISELVQSRKIVYNIRDLDVNALIAICDDLLKNHTEVEEEIGSNLGAVQQKALVTADLAAEILGVK